MVEATGLVTVAIPTRDRPRSLLKAVASVVLQSYGRLEIIVSDNNSSGDTRKSVAGVADPRIKYFRHDSDLTMTENWNFCLQRASGEYFLLLSDDDSLAAGAITELLKGLTDEGAVLSYGRAVFRDDAGGFLGVSRAAPRLEPGEAFIQASLSGLRNALPSATLFRTALARELGGYPEIGNSTDLALRLALATHGTVACVPAPILEYSIHPGGLSLDTAKTRESFLKLAEWAGRPSAPLAKWRGLVARYCAGSLRSRARRSALRGDLAGARVLLEASNLIAPGSRLADFAVEAFSWAPVRSFAGLLRAIRQYLRSVLFGRRV
ncbi:MAG: glycosyltransferase family 2 protein [Elusimicrobia bacterium]|nr:glycosyltransferase family 2 protein [Elusimicrobiota bacterium]